MKSHLTGLVAGVLLGAVLGWGIAAARRPEAHAPAPVKSGREAYLESEVTRLQGELAAARKGGDSTGATSPTPAPIPPDSATPPTARAIKAPAIPEDWARKVQELKASGRIKDLLDLQTPGSGGDVDHDCWRMKAVQIRDLLKRENAQMILLADLPSLSKQEMVVLWDVFWTGNPEASQGFSAYGQSFARRMSQSLLGMTTSPAAPEARSLAITMLAPDTRSLTDGELQQFRAIVAADPEPGVRQWAQRLPDRSTR